MSTTTEQELPLAERAYRRLRQAIIRCEFPPGQRLRIDELSKRYAISSSPLRESLCRLSEQGLVSAFENRGFHVAPVSVKGIADITRCRLLVELEVLEDALAHGNDAWESGIVAAAHSLSLVEQRLTDSPLVLDENWAQRHRDFHLAIYAGCSSPLLKEMAADLFDKADRYRYFSARHRKVDRKKNAEHQALLNALLTRDKSLATGMFIQHISATERNVTQALLHMGGGDVQ